MTAIDVSPGALALAAENAAANGLDERVELLEGDLLAPVAGRRFDLVVSNPPYVAAGDEVDPEVAGYEPAALAVYADDGGRAHPRAPGDGGDPRPAARAAGSPWSSATARRRGSPSASRRSATRASRSPATSAASSESSRRGLTGCAGLSAAGWHTLRCHLASRRPLRLL